MKNLSTALQAKINPLDNQLGYKGEKETLQDMIMGEGRRRGYNEFSLRMSSSLSKKMGVCVIENLSRVFFL